MASRYGASVASLVVERVLDGLSLAALLLLALRFVPAPPYLVFISVLIAGAFYAGADVLLLASWRASLIVTITDRLTRPFPVRAHDLAVKLATSFARALSLVRGGSGDWRASWVCRCWRGAAS